MHKLGQLHGVGAMSDEPEWLSQPRRFCPVLKSLDTMAIENFRNAFPAVLTQPFGMVLPMLLEI